VHSATFEIMDTYLPARLFTRDEYNRLGELGFFDRDERVELLRGVIVPMSAEGIPHTSTAVWFNRRLARGLDDEYFVRPGNPLAAGDDSEPVPDFAITKEDPRAGHPSTALLVIEIAHSSLRKDRGIKRELYGEAGVLEHWIVDVSEPKAISVEVYTEPTKHGFARMITLRDGDVLKPAHVPIEIAIADIPR
jgi:Uma2 family endonuclease